MSLANEMRAVDVALAAYERKTINPPEYTQSDSDQFVELDVATQLDMLADYFRKHPEQICNAGEYIATIPSQTLITIMLYGNPREIHTFHQQHFIEFFASRVQHCIDKGEIE